LHWFYRELGALAIDALHCCKIYFLAGDEAVFIFVLHFNSSVACKQYATNPSDKENPALGGVFFVAV
jgi:hypothetical protein